MKNYSFSEDIIIRTPLKPLKISFSETELQQLFVQKEVQEAMFLASPNLLDECGKWLNNEIKGKQEKEKLIFSLLKYAMRMHSRCTPFGLFAGCGIIQTSNQENIIINHTKYQRNTRLDMNFSCALAQELAKKTFIQPHLKFYPNTSIYNLYDKLRYVEYFYQNKRRVHQISAVDYSVYLQKIIKEAKKGARLTQLADLLTNEEIIYDEAEAFIQEVVNAQVLVSELEPSVTGDELLVQILSILIRINEKHPDTELNAIILLLQIIQNELQQIDAKIGNEITLYKKIADALTQFNIPFELNKLFQSDFFISPLPEKHTNDKINIENRSADILLSLKKALKVLNKLSVYHEPQNLKIFKENFYHRYENKEVLLSDVLDNESGIGYGNNNNQTGDINPLIDNLLLIEKYPDKSEIPYSKEQSFLFKKLIKAHQEKQLIISISNEELKAFHENWDDLPESISMMYSHLGKRNEKNLLYINSVGGSSAINLLGRFGVGNKKIEKIIVQIAQSEQFLNSDKILASILHLPESRTGNILLHPIIRNYEIPYLSKSLLSDEQQILLEDLVVSVKQNRVVLRSTRLNKEIIPRLDNAHNYSYHALPVYHFLCDLQIQNLRGGFYFDWGALKNEFSFLPRVEIENVIISLATWQLKKEQFKLLFENNKLIENAFIWQEMWKIPDLVLLADGDNELLINLKDELSISMFVAEIKNRSQIILKEFLFDEKTAYVKDENGNSYTNEFITILQKQELSTQTKNDAAHFFESKNAPQTTENLPKLIPRTFVLGSEWLYYKIYCGINTADRFLTNIIKPFTEQLIQEKLIDSWFFIRYSDPEVHLRVRFHFSDTRNIGVVIEKFHNMISFIQSTGLIWKVQTDTYQREIERYGFTSIKLSEQIFYYDSVCIVNLLEKIKGSKGEEIRWLFGIKAVNELFDNFNLNTEQKLTLTEHLKTNFSSEFNISQSLKKQLDSRYRKYRKEIESLLTEDNFFDKEYQFIVEILKQKEKQLIPVIKELINLQNQNQLHVQISALLSSYTHMLLNRLFRNKQRMHEMVIYDFMRRAYRSIIAQNKTCIRTNMNTQ